MKLLHYPEAKQVSVCEAPKKKAAVAALKANKNNNKGAVKTVAWLLSN